MCKGEQRRGIGPDGHKARMAQHQLAQYTGGEVEGSRQQHIDADGDDDSLILHRDESGLHHAIEKHEAQHQSHQISAPALGSPFCLIHILHLLKPSPARGVPAGPKA